MKISLERISRSWGVYLTASKEWVKSQPAWGVSSHWLTDAPNFGPKFLCRFDNPASKSSSSSSDHYVYDVFDSGSHSKSMFPNLSLLLLWAPRIIWSSRLVPVNLLKLSFHFLPLAITTPSFEITQFLPLSFTSISGWTTERRIHFYVWYQSYPSQAVIFTFTRHF